jgi:hypothetical protein
MSKFVRAMAVTFTVVGFITAPAFAGPISGLTTFVPGTPATAADVNSNFTIIRNAGNDTDTRLINVEANRVLKSGDTMSGPLTVPALNFATPKVAYWTFHGRGFVHDTGNGFASCTPETLSWNGVGSSTFRAPVMLPHGATITGVTYHYWKSTFAADNSTFTLKRNSVPSSGGTDTMATLTSSATAHTSVTTNTIATPVVDNQNFAYFMVVTLGGSAGQHCVDAVTIRYTYTSP